MTQQLSTSSVGRHSELLAMAALIADGWTVSEPSVPGAYDLLAEKDGKYVRVQVKTIKLRDKEGVPYYVIRGLKNSGVPYDKSDCDVFCGVVDGRVFMTEVRSISEYWARVDEVSEKWTELPVSIRA